MPDEVTTVSDISKDQSAMETKGKVHNHFEEHEDVSLMDRLGPGRGTNPGGIFKDHKTGEVLYVKLYRDSSQSSCEFIANKIYQILGAPVLEGSLAPNGDQIAYVTPYHEDLRKLPEERRVEAQKYFVAAAYLMDNDMVGIGPENPYGNLLVDKNGNFVLVDHGAALLFHGLIGRKEPTLLTDRMVSEINTMRMSRYNPRSKPIFESITRKEIERQAAEIILKITPEVIDEVVGASMLPDKDKEVVRNLLINRK